MTLLLIADLLSQLGLGGTIVAAASVLVAAYHGKGVLDFFSKIGVWVRIGGAIAVLIALAAVGVIPGVEIDIHIGELFSAVGPAISWVVERVLEVLPL